jgi:hypothetical protein
MLREFELPDGGRESSECAYRQATEMKTTNATHRVNFVHSNMAMTGFNI